MAFGFVIHRSGLLVRGLSGPGGVPPEDAMSFWLGSTFILAGALVALASTLEYRQLLKTLKPAEIPEGYRVGMGIAGNLVLALLGLVLLAYLVLAEFQRPEALPAATVNPGSPASPPGD
jgi:putative membrane protein